jgi:hypothetical protein
MTLYYPTNNCGDSSPFAAFLCSNCLTREFGSIRSLGFVQDSLIGTFDFSSSSAWSTAIANQTAFVYFRTKGEYDGGDTEVIDGYGDTAEDSGNTTHKATIFVPDVINNVDHWNYIKKRNDLVPVLRTQSRIWVFNEPCNIKVKMPIANDKKSVVEHNVLLTLIQDDLPTDYATPAGIFDRCYVSQP